MRPAWWKIARDATIPADLVCDFRFGLGSGRWVRSGVEGRREGGRMCG